MWAWLIVCVAFVTAVSACGASTQTNGAASGGVSGVNGGAGDMSRGVGGDAAGNAGKATTDDGGATSTGGALARSGGPGASGAPANAGGSGFAGDARSGGGSMDASAGDGPASGEAGMSMSGSTGVAGATPDPACPETPPIWNGANVCSAGTGCPIVYQPPGVLMACDCIDGKYSNCRFDTCPALMMYAAPGCPTFATLPDGCTCDIVPPPMGQFIGGCTCRQS